jgi:TolB-like protein
MAQSYGGPSIAVLPFRDMSPAGDQEYLSDGIAEELLNVLARLPDLRVISRTSSFAFKGQALEVPEIARRLKVAHVLEGSVRKSGNTIRVTAQLIEARSDTHLWSETWDRELTDVFAIQDEIAGSVVRSLRPVLLGEQPGIVELAVVETSTQAYEMVLRGRHLLHQFTGDTARRAEAWFAEAITIDPNYAPAHTGLAEAMRQQMSIGESDRSLVVPRVEAAVTRALELIPDEPDALALRGYLRFFMTSPPDIDGARHAWRRAIESNPSNRDGLRWLAFTYIDDDPHRFLDLMQEAYRVDPTHAITNGQLIMALSVFGRFDDAVSCFDPTLFL